MLICNYVCWPFFQMKKLSFSSFARVIVNYREIVSNSRSINYYIFKLPLVKAINLTAFWWISFSRLIHLKSL